MCSFQVFTVNGSTCIRTAFAQGSICNCWIETDPKVRDAHPHRCQNFGVEKSTTAPITTGPGAAGALPPVYPRERAGPEGGHPAGTSDPSCPARSRASAWGPPRFEAGTSLRPQLAPEALETTGLGY